jgi:hypothetical protein
MDGWTDFFVAEVGASAALAGLTVSFITTLQGGWVLLVEILR